MYYVVLDVGSIEKSFNTKVVGIYSARSDAEKVARNTRRKHVEDRWQSNERRVLVCETDILVT